MYFLNKVVKSGTYSAETQVLLGQGHPDKTAIVKEIILHNSDISHSADVELSIYDSSDSTRTTIISITLSEGESFQFSTLVNLTHTQVLNIKCNTTTVNAFATIIYVPAGD